MTPSIFNNALSRALLLLRDVSLLIFDEAHHCRKRHVYAEIMHKYRRLDDSDKPRVFGMTASPVNLKLSKNEDNAKQEIVAQIQQLEQHMDARVVTNYDQAEARQVRVDCCACSIDLQCDCFCNMFFDKRLL